MMRALLRWLELEVAIANDRPGSHTSTMERERWYAAIAQR